MSDLLDRFKSALADRYAIGPETGRGGMAVVYRAEDLRHHRQVAIKVLQPELAATLGAERFLQEIEIVAGLQHPHILPLYESGEAAGLLYYVMPFAEGESLRQRLDREKQLAVDESVRIAVEVADGLDYAHRKGVVHRDIKPGNILLVEGHAVIADFGIARAIEVARQDRITSTGLGVGTPLYASPEQATAGETLDGRTDIYSLGCVLYEMLAGEPPLTGSTPQMIRARRLAETPTALHSVRDTVPPALDRVIARALARVPADRYATASQFGQALQAVLFASTPSAGAGIAATPVPLPAVAAPNRGNAVRRRLVAASTILAIGVLVTLAVLWPRVRRLGSPAPPEGAIEPVALTISLPDTDTLIGPTWSIALSPDGETLVYAAIRNGASHLFRRVLRGFDAEPITGTDGADSPFFSPDGQWLGFFVERERVLKKVPLGGGEPHILAASDGADGTWGDHGSIAFLNFPHNGLWKVPASGGVATPLTDIERHFPPGEEFHRNPRFLPGGSQILFTGWSMGGERVGLYDVQTDVRTTLIEGGAAPRYLDTGHLVYARTAHGDLLVVSFDRRTLHVGVEESVLDGVATSWRGYANYDVTRGGHLAYVPGEPAGPLRRLLWARANGDTEPIDLEPGDYRQARVSPDGRRIALAMPTGRVTRKTSIWTADVHRPVLTRLTDEAGTETWPVWSLDGSRIFFNSNRYEQTEGAPYNLYWKAADGTGTEERLAESDLYQQPYSVHPDGRTIAFQENSDPVTGSDIAFLDLGVERRVRRLPELGTRANEMHPAISPDGEWLAYASDATDRYEVYVRPFGGRGRATQVSRGGGLEPIWDSNGSRIYFRDVSGDSLYAVPFADASPGDPELLLTGPYLEGWPPGRNYDLAPDGRFLMITETDRRIPAREIRVILNWGATLPGVR